MSPAPPSARSRIQSGSWADTGISESEVSRICANLDEQAADFVDRTLVEIDPLRVIDATYCNARVVAPATARAPGWTPKRRWSPPASPPTAAGRSSGSLSETPRTGVLDPVPALTPDLRPGCHQAGDRRSPR